MKRLGYLFEKVYDINNIELADDKARKNKIKKYGINRHDKNRTTGNLKLSENIKNLNYHTSEYSTFVIYEPKERLIYRLPYYPDRITHHAIMNILEPFFIRTFITNTYSCIKLRGIHKLVKDLKKALKQDLEGTKYCLKFDIKKFYPSIDHDVLYSQLCLKIKDKKLLKLLKEIIESAQGVPIGNYLSLYFANFYMSGFDHWMKEKMKCKYYFRYADDIVILHYNKEYLSKLFVQAKQYINQKLKLGIKHNYLIFPVDSRGIDFVGYRFYHTHTLLRKSIKIRLLRLLNKYIRNKIDLQTFKARMWSYFGWMKYCNSKHLLHKIQLTTGVKFSNWDGLQIRFRKILNKTIFLVDIQEHNKYFCINFLYNKKPYSIKSCDKFLFKQLINLKLPTLIKIIKYEKSNKNSEH